MKTVAIIATALVLSSAAHAQPKQPEDSLAGYSIRYTQCMESGGRPKLNESMEEGLDRVAKQEVVCMRRWGGKITRDYGPRAFGEIHTAWRRLNVFD